MYYDTSISLLIPSYQPFYLAASIEMTIVLRVLFGDLETETI